MTTASKQSPPPAVRHTRRLRVRRLGIGGVLVLVGVCVAYALLVAWSFDPDAIPLEYVGGTSCIECHEKEYALWRGSDHDLAMDHATAKTVLGDFDDVTFTHVGFDDLLALSDDELRIVLTEVAMPRVALGLQDAKQGVELRLRAIMTPEENAALGAAIANLGVFRPCDITTAHQEMADFLRHLADEGRISIDFGVTTRFFRDGERFMVTTDGRDGMMRTFEVKYVFGVRPLQQYLVEFDDGRIQCLAIAWDTVRGQWYHLYPKEQIPHDDPLHWTRPLQNWNYMCAECHTTNLQKNYDLATNTYRTTWKDINVHCEACHGPGSRHVRLATENKPFWIRRFGTGLMNLTSADAEESIDSCAPCHARRRVVAAGPKPPESPMMDYYHPEMLDGHLYYADGQILDENFEYASFLQSRMYHEKVRCTNCHDPHSLQVKYEDNRLCTQIGCHIPATYDTVAHHRHPDATQPGTLCVECHMPETTYMVVDPRRDHGFRVPRPDLTVELGIPNACNLCHNDVAAGETAAWAENHCRTWYGPLDEPTHFAHGIAKGRLGEPDGEELLVAITRRPGVEARPLVRASAVLLLGRYDSPASEARRFAALEDEEAILRAAGVISLESDLQTALARDRAALDRLLARLVPRLSDPIRAVRTETARLLARVPQDVLPESARGAFERALDEYIDSQRAVEDQAAAHLNLGVLYNHLAAADLAAARRHYERSIERNPGSAAEAEARYLGEVRRLTQATYESYHRAARIDPEFVPVRHNLAVLCSERGDSSEAEEHLRKVLSIDDTMADVHYALGLLLAEDAERLAEAVTHLERAAELRPEHPRTHYNHGLALQNLQRPEEAERAFLRAIQRDGANADFRHALAVLHAQQERWDDAAREAAQAATLSGGEPRFVVAYVSFLAESGRWDDALAVVERMRRLDPTRSTWELLDRQLRRRRAEAATQRPAGATRPPGSD